MVVNSKDTSPIRSLDGSDIEKVDDFNYLGGLTKTEKDLNSRIGQAWGALNALTKVWKAHVDNKIKINVFKLSVEKILLYGSESWALSKSLAKSLDGKYTRMLRIVLNVPPNTRISNKHLYGKLQPISCIVRKRRLALAGHVARRNEPASQLLLWSPDSKRKVGRPSTTLKSIIMEDTGLTKNELLNIWQDRDAWKEFVIASPTR